jgi:hypothetical protein
MVIARAEADDSYRYRYQDVFDFSDQSRLKDSALKWEACLFRYYEKRGSGKYQ